MFTSPLVMNLSPFTLRESICPDVRGRDLDQRHLEAPKAPSSSGILQTLRHRVVSPCDCLATMASAPQASQRPALTEIDQVSLPGITFYCKLAFVSLPRWGHGWCCLQVEECKSCETGSCSTVGFGLDTANPRANPSTVWKRR